MESGMLVVVVTFILLLLLLLLFRKEGKETKGRFLGKGIMALIAQDYYYRQTDRQGVRRVWDNTLCIRI
jgi:Na+/proline symporter